MDYTAHYRRLIDRALDRTLDGYRERHHVLPRCMGGTDAPGNLVELTAEEHYVAHQLLVKMNPHNGRLVHSAVLMSTRCSNSKVYGWLKRRHIAQLTENMMGNKHDLGYRHTEDAKERMSNSRKGKKHSAEWSAKIAAASRGNTRARGKKLPPFTEEHRAKLSAAKIGKPSNRRGTVTSAETRIKLRAAHQGANGKAKPAPKKPFTPEHSAKIAAALRGIKRPPQSPEHRAKLATAMRAYWSTRTNQLDV